MKHALALIIEEEGRKARIKGREEGKKEGRIAGIKAGKKEGRKEGRREGRKEGIQKGRVEGKKDAELQTAKRMMESGIDEDLILKCCQLTVKEIEMIRQEMILP